MMLWIILGGFYLLLMTFFLGALALSRRADDQARHLEQQLLEPDQADTTRNANRIHRLGEVDQNHAHATTPPLTDDSSSDRRLAG